MKNRQKAEVIFIKSEISNNNDLLCNLKTVISVCSIKLENELNKQHLVKFVYISIIEKKQTDRIKDKTEKKKKYWYSLDMVRFLNSVRQICPLIN